MDTYQGACKYCGNIQPVLAMDQTDADEKISEECSCGGAELERKKECLLDNIKKLVGDDAPSAGLTQLTDDQEEIVTEAGLKVLHGHMDKAVMKFGTVTVAVNDGEKIKVTRTDKSTEKLEA